MYFYHLRTVSQAENASLMCKRVSDQNSPWQGNQMAVFPVWTVQDPSDGVVCHLGRRATLPRQHLRKVGSGGASIYMHELRRCLRRDSGSGEVRE